MNLLYSTIYGFFTLAVGQIIINDEFKLVFYLTMLLLYITINNIEYSIRYYIRLRNLKGIKGERGDPGDPGQDGSNGVCIMSNKCSIVKCKDLIMDELKVQFPSYKNISDKVNDNIKLTANEMKLQDMVNKYLNILLPVCENSELSNSEFRDIIKKTIENSN
tara:strand:- start:3900 stop:4385 length:486 start_codon:yes stop_codon:yes gene_type:complete